MANVKSQQNVFQRYVRHTQVWQFFVRLLRRYNAANVPLLSAALTYYAVFSLGPLLLILAGGLAFFLGNRPDLAADYRAALVEFVSQLLPMQYNSAQITAQSFDTALNLLQQGALLRSIISLGVLLWASSNFFTLLQHALEIIFDAPSPRGFWRKRLVALLLIMGVGTAIGAEVLSSAFINSVEQILTSMRNFFLAVSSQELPWFFSIHLQVSFFSNLLRTGFAAIVFTLCFKYLPGRGSTWEGALIGGAFSTAATLLMRVLFARFFNLDNFNLVYGLITSLLLILLWFYLSLQMFLSGGLFAAEISALPHQRRQLSGFDSSLSYVVAGFFLRNFFRSVCSLRVSDDALQQLPKDQPVVLVSYNNDPVVPWLLTSLFPRRLDTLLFHNCPPRQHWRLFVRQAFNMGKYNDEVANYLRYHKRDVLFIASEEAQRPQAMQCALEHAQQQQAHVIGVQVWRQGNRFSLQYQPLWHPQASEKPGQSLCQALVQQLQQTEQDSIS